ncbi:hypothetical protein [Sphingomonas sp. PAMC 26617]|uniref:hypothetical protein n=1 Tax=Sphingomonas sp. PAMC 26617 TaxID=1112216 RepID=UPI00028A2FB7|nr:hypothetical protein [Sphingomonas sp. PAMC 26617]
MGERPSETEFEEATSEIVPPPPRSWENWKKFLEGLGALQISELRLYTDVDFVAEAYNFGPYSFLNALAHSRKDPGALRPGIVLRVEWHLMADMRVPMETNDDHYHGGDLFDELTALASLLLDARIMAGPVDREFRPGEDPMGRPRGYDASYLPALPQSNQRPQLPYLTGSRDLRDLADLGSLPHLTPGAAAALIKAARLFQNALWVADTSPENAWLLLVSAIETAAAHWDSDKRTPEERFALSYGGVINMLKKANVEKLIPKMARAFNGVIGATSKFVGFLEAFSPGEPEKRPMFDKLNYSQQPMTAAFKCIYALRSRALHAGVPFPYPMCIPPERFDEGPYGEVPGGLAASARGATWNRDDTPMLLHTFAYLARGALLAWWRTLIPEEIQERRPIFSERLTALGPVSDRFRPFAPDPQRGTGFSDEAG